MATPDHTTKRRQVRTRAPQASSALFPLKPAIDAERRQLMRAHAVIKCLSAALLHAIDDDEATYYVDTAQVAADLIDAAVGRLEVIAERADERAMPNPLAVEESRPVYLC